jgi:hypothetical protein
MRISQATEGKAVTARGETSSRSENGQLVSGLFSEAEIDADLKLIIEQWPRCSVELRKAIVRMVKRGFTLESGNLRRLIGIN